MIRSPFPLNISDTLVTGKSPSATMMRSCLWSRLGGQEVTVKGEFQCALLSNICSVTFEFFLVLFCTATYALCVYNCLQCKLKLTLVTYGFPNLSCSLYCHSNTSLAAQLTAHLQGGKYKVQSARCSCAAGGGDRVAPQGPLYSHLAYNRFKIVHTASPQSVQRCRSHRLNSN